MSFVRTLLGTIEDLLFPPFCVLCGPLVEEDGCEGLCASCLHRIRVDPPGTRCVVCGGPSPALLAREGRCLACRRRRPAYDHLSVLGPYASGLRDVVAALKYGRKTVLMRPLGRLLAHRESELQMRGTRFGVDRIVPVPLVPSRWKERGFNQSELIARGLPEVTGAELRPRALRRRRGSPQVGRGRAGRARLSAAEFEVTEGVWGRRILLVDDVVTTGATIRAASRALVSAGALRVRVACVAHADV